MFPRSLRFAAAVAAIALASWQWLGSYTSDGASHLPYVQGPKRWAVIAGGSDGIGEAWANQLADAGLSLVLIARRKAPLAAVAEAIQKKQPSIEVVTLQLDLGKLTETQVREEILVPGRDVRVLVCNAAYSAAGFFTNNTVSQAMQVVDVNVRSAILLSHLVATRLRESQSGGGIVLMSSMAGTVGTAFVANYAASKAYLTTLAQGLAVELKPSGIDVLACVAGATTTPTYLGTQGSESGSSSLIEQTSEQVVTECLAALGRVSTTATGPLNKLVREVFGRLLPRGPAVAFMSHSTGVQMGWSTDVLYTSAVKH